MQTWHEIWTMYFYQLDNPEIWQEELQEIIRPAPTEREISNAVRAMSRDDKCPKRPTLKDLRIQIYRWRKQMQPENDKPEGSCSFCRDGWISYRPNPEWFYEVDIPCRCSRGQHWLKQHYSEFGQNKRQLLIDSAAEARGQIQARNDNRQASISQIFRSEGRGSNISSDCGSMK